MEPSDLAESELLISQLLLHWFGEDLRYCFDEKLWYVWDGKCFVPDERGEIIELGKQTVLKRSEQLMDEHRSFLEHAAEKDGAIESTVAEMRQEINALKAQIKERDKAFKDEKDSKSKEVLGQEIAQLDRQLEHKSDLLNKSREQLQADAKTLRAEARKRKSEVQAIQKLNCIEHAIELAQSHTQVRVAKNDFDADANLLNAQNGVINLLNGELVPHNRKYLHSKICSVDYEANHTSDDLAKVLENVCNEDADTQRYLKQALGATSWEITVSRSFISSAAQLAAVREPYLKRSKACLPVIAPHLNSPRGS